jgi:hypothetical protein
MVREQPSEATCRARAGVLLWLRFALAGDCAGGDRLRKRKTLSESVA